MNHPHTDGASWTLCFITIAGAWSEALTKSNVLFLITVLSGATSIVYNMVKTWREWKKKQ